MTEEKLDPKILADIEASATDGARIVGTKPNLPPLSIVESIDSWVERAQSKDLAQLDVWTEMALPIGSLWGKVLSREFGWEWTMVIFPNEAEGKAVGIFSPERDLGIFTFHEILGCLKNRALVNILVAFNMLRTGQLIGKARKGEYLNVMPHVSKLV